MSIPYLADAIAKRHQAVEPGRRGRTQDSEAHQDVVTRIRSRYRRPDDYSALTHGEQLVYTLAVVLDSEVNDGGFDQYLLNASGDTAERAKHFLRELDEVDVLRLLEDLSTIFPSGVVPDDHAARQEMLVQIGENDPIWSRTVERANADYRRHRVIMHALLMDYVEAHTNEFALPTSEQVGARAPESPSPTARHMTSKPPKRAPSKKANAELSVADVLAIASTKKFSEELSRLVLRTRVSSLESLPELIRMLRVLFYFEAEIGAHGIARFLTDFERGTGAYIGDLAALARQIGAHALAEYLEGTIALFPNAQVPTDFAARFMAVRAVDKELKALDKAYKSAVKTAMEPLREWLCARPEELETALAAVRAG